MFLLPERAASPPSSSTVPVESRQFSGALRFGSLGGHISRSADPMLGSIDSESLVSLDTEGCQVEYNSRPTRSAEEYRRQSQGGYRYGDE